MRRSAAFRMLGPPVQVPNRGRSYAGCVMGDGLSANVALVISKRRSFEAESRVMKQKIASMLLVAAVAAAAAAAACGSSSSNSTNPNIDAHNGSNTADAKVFMD